jgi:hypothetical protein
MDAIITSVPNDIRAQIITTKTMDNMDDIVLYSRNTLAVNGKDAIAGADQYVKLRALRQLIINETHEITVCSNFDDGVGYEPTKIRLKDLLLSDNIVTKDKITYFSRYLDGNPINPAVFRIKSANDTNIIKYFDNKNNAKAKNNELYKQSNLTGAKLGSLKVAPILPVVVAVAANQGSQAEVPGGVAAAAVANRKFPGGYFSFTVGANNVNNNSVLSQINLLANNFEYGTVTNEKSKNNLRELLLNLYTFIYGFRPGVTEPDYILNYIKTNLESIGHSKCYKEYLNLYNEKYNNYVTAAAAVPAVAAGAAAKFVCDVINDIIISVVRIAIYNIAIVIKDKTGMAGANAAQIYTSIDIIGIILKKFSEVPFSIGQPINAPVGGAPGNNYNIFLYPNALGIAIAIAIANFGLGLGAGGTIYDVPRLCNYCILKIISIVLGNAPRYQIFREIPVKFLLTSVIYVLQYDEAFVFRILFGFTKFLGANDAYKNYDYLFLAMVIKFRQYFEMYEIEDNNYTQQLLVSIKVPAFVTMIGLNPIIKDFTSK